MVATALAIAGGGLALAGLPDKPDPEGVLPENERRIQLKPVLVDVPKAPVPPPVYKLPGAPPPKSSRGVGNAPPVARITPRIQQGIDALRTTAVVSGDFGFARRLKINGFAENRDFDSWKAAADAYPGSEVVRLPCTFSPAFVPFALPFDLAARAMPARFPSLDAFPDIIQSICDLSDKGFSSVLQGQPGTLNIRYRDLPYYAEGLWYAARSLAQTRDGMEAMVAAALLESQLWQFGFSNMKPEVRDWLTPKEGDDIWDLVKNKAASPPFNIYTGRFFAPNELRLPTAWESFTRIAAKVWEVVSSMAEFGLNAIASVVETIGPAVTAAFGIPSGAIAAALGPITGGAKTALDITSGIAGFDKALPKIGDIAKAKEFAGARGSFTGNTTKAVLQGML